MRQVLLGMAMMLALTTGASSQDKPLNVGEWQSAVQILKGAKTKVEGNWGQGPNAGGGSRTTCLSVAMEQSWAEQKKTMVDFDYAKMALSRAINMPLEPMKIDGDPLSTPYWGRNFVYYNDAPGRTEAEVLAALDRAIALAKEQEQAAIAANRPNQDLLDFDTKAIQGLAKP
jgi:hypothetical protein